MSASRTGCFALAWLLAVSLPAGAEMRVRRGPDGVPHLYNVPGPRSSAARRTVLRVPPAELAALIQRYAEENELEPTLVRAVIQVESGFDPGARSHKGAMGLMQLMPGTATELGVEDPFDPEANIRGGTTYLRQMLDRFEGNLSHALAGYNAGPEAVSRYGGIPPYLETRHYVARVLGLVRGEPVALPPAARGRPVYVTRDAAGQVLITTRRPAR